MTKLITTHPDYFMLVDEEAETKGCNSLIVRSFDNAIILDNVNSDNRKGEKFYKLLAHLPKANQPLLEGVAKLPDLPKVEEDVEKLADEANGYTVFALYTKAPVFKEGFIAGYKAKQSENKYIDIIEQLNLLGLIDWSKTEFKTNKKLAESLTTPQQPKGFEMEMEDGCVGICMEIAHDDEGEVCLSGCKYKGQPKIINNTICGKWIF